MADNLSTDPKSLAKMLELDESAWADESPERDLPAMWKHQLAAPLAGEIKSSDASDAGGSFAELFSRADPSIAMLEEVKNFAKANRASRDPSVKQISTMLYYCSIAAAKARLNKRITDLTDEQFRSGIKWGLEQNWIDPATRVLLSEVK